MSDPTPEMYPVDAVLQKKPWTLADSYRYCERLTRRHYENFPVGSLLIPKKLRPHVCAIYAFARRADDIADEDFPKPTGFRRSKLGNICWKNPRIRASIIRYSSRCVKPSVNSEFRSSCSSICSPLSKWTF